MKAKFITATIAKMAMLIILFSVSFSCGKDVSYQEKSQPATSNSVASDDLAKVAHPPYNLDVVLFGPGNNGGFIRFRQNKDTAKIINLDTWVGNLKPNHTYLLQRAVNPITDTAECSSTAWLTLGEGLQPKSIVTDAAGNGKAKLWRDLSAIASGTEFYIHFQVIDSVSTKVVVSSECYQYTLR